MVLAQSLGAGSLGGFCDDQSKQEDFRTIRAHARARPVGKSTIHCHVRAREWSKNRCKGDGKHMSKHPEAPGYRGGWCIHYRSPVHGDTCSAGVRYNDLRDGDAAPKMDRSPCFIKPGETAADRSPCEKLRPPTDEEISAYKGWQDTRVAHLMAALRSISDWVTENKGRRAHIIIKCPACGGNLKVAKAACNDHTQGQCMRSATCIGWIQ